MAVPAFLASLFGLGVGATGAQVAGAAVRTVLPMLGSAIRAKADLDSRQTDLGGLRDRAVAAGFNPLTVLNATGGQGFGKASPSMGALAFSFAGDALNATWEANQAAQNWEIERALGMKALNATDSGLPDDEWGRLYPDPNAWVNVLAVDGTPFQIKAGLAKRLRIFEGDMIIGGDWEEVYGDLISEGKNISDFIRGLTAEQILGGNRHAFSWGGGGSPFAWPTANVGGNVITVDKLAPSGVLSFGRTAQSFDQLLSDLRGLLGR